MTLSTTQTARKRYRCEHRYGHECSGWIEPGECYVRSSLPPGAEPMYADGWMHMRHHPADAES